MTAPFALLKKFNLIIPAVWLCIACIAGTQFAWGQPTVTFDFVLTGGRVIDPETGLDAVKNVGIQNGRITEISDSPLVGRENIDVSGLVVAPGFIDLHIHGIGNKEQEYQAHDGVTTALELEWGVGFLKEWYAARSSKALINYGASAPWFFNRFKTLPPDNPDDILQLEESIPKQNFNFIKTLAYVAPSFDKELSDAQLAKMLDNIRQSLADGGVGIGVPVGYVPGAGREEIFRVYQLAGSLQAPVFTHIRKGGVMAVQQVISDAVLTNAPLHIVHINSMTLSEIELAIEMVNTAQKRGFDITTELYPYTAASTDLASALFDEGWQQRFGMEFNDLQWVATGERLTEETFNMYRKEGGTVIMYMMRPAWIKAGIASKGTIIASDGMPYAKLAHPRTAGTFSRVLGKYVREDKVLSLTEAIEKITLLPAKRLEEIAPMMRFKGRIQVGSDADITIFDPATIIDKATFDKGLEFSEGIRYVMVNGMFVIKNGNTVEGAFPGQPIYGKYKK